MRVVSLACSNTEIVCALGAAELLVGVDDHSDYPAEVVGRLPRVGPDLSVDIDRIAALKPDLVLASLTVPGHERNVAALAARGLPFIAPEPRRLLDVYDDIHLIGRALERSAEADALVQSMQADITPELGGELPSVLVEWWPKPVIAPGRESWVTDLLRAAGGRNPLAERDVKSTPLSDDELRALDPEAVVICWCGVRFEKYRPDVVQRRPALQGGTALRRGNVFCIPEAYLGRPGPRLVEGFRALSAVVRSCLERRG
ncbi:MAG TPA: helical backbone metal receptor [Polyangiaceae bacterium]|nr:helical backbone metal receptor [Polyangiaceae bacterium]